MSFIYPLGLLGLLAIPIIIIIYILRSKYKTKTVSSSFIWKRSLKYVKRRIPLNFIMSLLLILQILTVVAASFAIARPTVKPLKSNEKIVIIDASASMLAENGGVTRFDHAKKLVEESINKASANNQITLIVAGENATSVIKRETDKGKLLTALRGIECTMGTANINGALEMAGEILNQNAGATIQLYTDKSYIDVDGLELVDCKREGEWNAGVLSFTDNETATGTEFLVTVGNYGLDYSYSIKLNVDGEWTTQTIDLKANEVRNIRFTHSSTESIGTDEIRIRFEKAVKSYEKATVSISSNDNLSIDDSMDLYPREKIKPKILYVSKYVERSGGKATCDASLLYRAFMAAGYNIDSSNMYSDPEQLDEFKGFDLYIFEGVEPFELPTDGAVWLLDAKKAPADTLIEISTEETNLTASGAVIEKSLSLDAITSIAKNVNLAPLRLTVAGNVLEVKASVSKFHGISNLGTFKPIYTAVYKETEDGKEKTINEDIMVGGSLNSVRMIVSTFDFGNTSLGIFVSDFPILVKNMVEYSIPAPVDNRTAPVGSEVTFNFPAGASEIAYMLNDELIGRPDVNGLNHTVKINEPGKYEIIVTYKQGEGENAKVTQKHYTVTGHISEEESMVVQRVPTESISAPEPLDGTQETLEPVEIFPYLIALMILLLIFEWGVYYREHH